MTGKAKTVGTVLSASGVITAIIVWLLTSLLHYTVSPELFGAIGIIVAAVVAAVREHFVVSSLLIFLIAFMLPQRVFADCLTRTSNNEVLILIRSDDMNLPEESGWTMKAFDREGACVGEIDLPPPTQNFALTVWGGDMFTPGPAAGDSIYLGLEQQTPEYTLLYDLANEQLIYEPGGIKKLTQLKPLYSATTASIAFTDTSLEPRGNEWQSRIKFLADGPIGGLLVRIRSQDGARIIRTAGSNIINSYISDTVAVVFLQATDLSRSIIEAYGEGVGTVRIVEATAVDTSGALVNVDRSAGTTLDVAPFLAGDVSGDGLLDSSDQSALFFSLIGVGPLITDPHADVFPYPEGDGMIDLRDLWKISVLIRTPMD